MARPLWLIATHAVALAAGFALGVYTLPILIAPPAPSAAAVRSLAAQASWHGAFRRDLRDSDALHWGEGRVSITPRAVTLDGRLAPGPDYKLYFSPEFVETEADFLRLKPRMQRAGDVRTFDNFVVELPPDLDPSRFTAVVVWCERFGQFISAARYR